MESWPKQLLVASNNGARGDAMRRAATTAPLREAVQRRGAAVVHASFTVSC